MLNILDYDRETLQKLLAAELSLEPFRATQIFRWLYKERVSTFDAMTDIAKPVRQKLSEHFIISRPQIKLTQLSKDGTKKYLFELEDGECIESVLIKQPKRYTLCTSSQVGCAMGCKFCKTATLGFKRNLKVHEIIGQILAVKEDIFGSPGDDDFYNIVLMGMGEPLNNLDNVLTVINILGDDYGLGFSERKITISTSGVVPEIAKLAAAKKRGNLAVSLNATDNETRSKIMPINKRYPIETLIDALRQFPLKGRQRITIEYVLLKGINDSPEDRKRLKKILHNIPVKINLIPYNANPELSSKLGSGFSFEPPDRETIMKWQDELLQSKLNATIRWSKGEDISAACGQLAAEGIK